MTRCDPNAPCACVFGTSDPEMDEGRKQLADLYEQTQLLHHFVDAVSIAVAAKVALEKAIEHAAETVLNYRPGKAGELANYASESAQGRFAGWHLYTRITFRRLEPGVFWDSWPLSTTPWKPYGISQLPNDFLNDQGKLYQRRYDAIQDADKAMDAHMKEWLREYGNILTN